MIIKIQCPTYTFTVIFLNWIVLTSVGHMKRSSFKINYWYAI